MPRKLALLIACLTTFALPAVAEDAQSILAKVREKQLQRWSGVDRYAIDKTVLGNRATILYERFESTGADGQTHSAFRAAPLGAMTDEVNAGGDTATLMTEYAKGLEMVGAGLSSETSRGLEQAGLPPGLFKAMGAGADPWTSPDPGTMMTGLAPAARDMAGAEANLEAAAKNSAAAETEQMEAFSAKARLIGTETIDGRQAFHLRAEDLNQVQQVDGQTFELDVANLWIDTTEYVPLRSRIEGVATSAGESRPVALESVNSDYRRVSGSTMYEPFRQSARMSGLVSPEQQAEMQAANQKLAEMDAQLAKLPESQRQMVMAQMAPQLEMMRKMSAGGGFEMETVVHQIVVNPDAAALRTMQSKSVAIAGQAMPMLPPGNTTLPTSAGSAASPPPAAAQARDADSLKKAQQACLAEKAREAEAAKKKKRGLGSLMSAVGRVASEFGAAGVTRATGDIYTANATAEDLAAAARDLGLSEEDVAECQNP